MREDVFINKYKEQFSIDNSVSHHTASATSTMRSCRLYLVVLLLDVVTMEQTHTRRAAANEVNYFSLTIGQPDIKSKTK